MLKVRLRSELLTRQKRNKPAFRKYKNFSKNLDPSELFKEQVGKWKLSFNGWGFNFFFYQMTEMLS